MNTQAYFDNIQERIANELWKTNHSIIVAVAWFTDGYLFSILCDKARNGIDVKALLMDDFINNSSAIDYNELINAGGKVWKISNEGGSNRLMHNKFCIIDEHTIINGSYNWSNKAQHNHESITVIKDADLAHQFIEEFNIIKLHYFGNEMDVSVNYAKICIRLETLKSVILLEDEEDILFQTNKLKKVLPNKNGQLSLVWAIIHEIENKHYGSVISKIIDFISRQNAVIVHIDEQIVAMQLELRVLGLQISSLEDEKTEIEKIFYLFDLRHNRELGLLIVEILKFRRTKLREEAEHDKTKQKSAEEAETDYKEYQKSYEESSKKNVVTLSDEDQAEIKQSYRKATKLCHPDVVNEAQKEQAEVIFQALKDAYDGNDLQKVKSILSDLEKGIFTNRTETITEKFQLQASLTQLRRHRDDLERALMELKKTESYDVISDTDNWDTYFENTKIQLEDQLSALTNDLEYKFR